MKHLGDITKIHNPEPVWIVCGGSPCQDLSIAGLRKGLAGERSGLFMEQIRIIKEMRENDRRNGRTNELCRPRFMVWENVPGALSSNNGEDFRCVLEETVRIAEPNANVPRPAEWRNVGCIVGHGWSVAWRVHDAQFWGVPQRRRRIALVADFAGQCAAEILFERISLQRDTSEINGERKANPGTSADGFRQTISFQDRCGKDSIGKPQLVYGIVAKNSNSMMSDNPYSGIYEADTARTVGTSVDPTCNQGGMVVLGYEAFQHYGYRESETLGCLTAGQNQGVRGDTPIMCFSEKGFAEFEEETVSASLRHSGGPIGGAQKH